MTCVADVGVVFCIIGHVLTLADVAFVLLRLSPVVVCGLYEGHLTIILAPGVVLFAFEACVRNQLYVAKRLKLFHHWD